MIRIIRLLIYLIAGLAACSSASAMGYNIGADNDNTTIRFHILFPIYGRIAGRFDKVRGRLDLDEKNPANSKIIVEVDTASINSNHQARDAYLRSSALLSAREYPRAFFKSDAVNMISRNQVVINGHLTLRGITRPITVRSFLVGKTFQGTTSFHLSNFGINGFLGLLAAKLHLTMRIKNVR